MKKKVYTQLFFIFIILKHSESFNYFVDHVVTIIIDLRLICKQTTF
jgi:hypothetical protein